MSRRPGSIHTDMVERVSREGKELARGANDELLRVSHSGTLPVEVTLPTQVNANLKVAMKERLAARTMEKNIKKKKLQQEYMTRRHQWELSREDAKSYCDTSEIDKFLLNATMGILTSPEAALLKIRQEGGTAGGVGRWAESIVAIPDQEPDIVPSSGGGILVENPLQEYFHSENINAWDHGEKLLFLHKYVKYGDNLRKIAKFLEFKSEVDVVMFYYKNMVQFDLENLRDELMRKGKKEANNHLLELLKLPATPRISPDN